MGQKDTFPQGQRVEKALFLLCMEPELDAILYTLGDAFGVQPVGGNVLACSQGDLHMRFVVLTKRMGEEQKQSIEQNLERIWAHFYQVDTPYHDLKVNLLHQIQMTRSLVSLVCSFVPEEGVQKEAVVWKILSENLPALRGVMLVENGRCFLDEKGSVLMADDGSSQAGSFFPLCDEPEESLFVGAARDQLERRRASLDFLKQRQIFVTPWLPLLESEGQAVVRPVQEVARRAGALLVLALYSEYMLGEKMKPQAAREAVRPVCEAMQAQSAFSPAEQAYFDNPQPSELDCIQFVWQYEGLLVMEWAMGLLQELPYPDKVCNVSEVERLMADCGSLSSLISRAAMRPVSELLDAADLAYRMDWACVDARLHHLQAPGGLDSGVVMERHKSLNWLIDSAQCGWDEVELST